MKPSTATWAPPVLQGLILTILLTAVTSAQGAEFCASVLASHKTPTEVRHTNALNIGKRQSLGDQAVYELGIYGTEHYLVVFHDGAPILVRDSLGAEHGFPALPTLRPQTEPNCLALALSWLATLKHDSNFEDNLKHSQTLSGENPVRDVWQMNPFISLNPFLNQAMSSMSGHLQKADLQSKATDLGFEWQGETDWVKHAQIEQFLKDLGLYAILMAPVKFVATTSIEMVPDPDHPRQKLLRTYENEKLVIARGGGGELHAMVLVGAFATGSGTSYRQYVVALDFNTQNPQVFEYPDLSFINTRIVWLK